MDLFPSPSECLYQNWSAAAIFLIDFLLLCLGFLRQGRCYGTTKEVELLLNLLRLGAFDRLLFSLSLHYCNETFHIGWGDSRSQGCGCLLEWRLCEMQRQGEALWRSQEPDDDNYHWVLILARQQISTYTSKCLVPTGLGELVSPWSMSIAKLSKTASGDAGLVNFCHRVFSLCCITKENTYQFQHWGECDQHAYASVVTFDTTIG